MGPLLLDAVTNGLLDSSALAAASATLLEAASSVVDRRLACCRSAIAEVLGAAEGNLCQRLEILVNKCLRLRLASVVRVDDTLVQVRSVNLSYPALLHYSSCCSLLMLASRQF